MVLGNMVNMQLMMFALAAIGFLIRKKGIVGSEGKRKPLKYATIVSNGGFLGNPVIEGLYGSGGLFYASVFMLPVRVLMWTIGTSCFVKGDKVHVLKKSLMHPCIVAIYLGLAAMLVQVNLPVFLEKTI